MLRPYGNRPNAVKDLRWETRLLALVAAILVVFGLTAVYGASSLLTISGGQVGSSFALKRSEEHTSELQSHSFISYADFCLKKNIMCVGPSRRSSHAFSKLVAGRATDT